MNDALQKYALRGDQRHQVFARGRNSEELWCQEKTVCEDTEARERHANTGGPGPASPSGYSYSEEIVARERSVNPGGPGPALPPGSSFDKVESTKELRTEVWATAQTNNLFIAQNVLNQSCVMEVCRSVQSEAHLEKERLASEVKAMQATANLKHEELVHQVAHVSWDAARQEAKAAIDLNEERCRVAVQQAEVVAE